MPSVDRIKARLTEPPSVAPRAAPFLPPGTARTTSVSPEFLPERSVGPEAWGRPQHAQRTDLGPRRRRPWHERAGRSRGPMTSAQEHRDLGRIDPDFQGTGRRVGLTGWEAFRVSGMGFLAVIACVS